MNRQHILLKTLPVAVVTAFVATRLGRGRAGTETFLCEGSRCSFDSGATWLLTGVTIIGPFIAVLGFSFARRLHYRDRLGPFSHRAIPDGEQILEVLGIVASGALAYWVLRNGPTIEAIDDGGLNRVAADILGEDDVPSSLVPNRQSWFAIGAILSAPFAFSLGSMFGREWYGRKRRKTQEQLAATEVIVNDDQLLELDYADEVISLIDEREDEGE
ncbi:MAG: hypothetical protein ACI81L_000535 [Verrucomicrobiales bacterium]|jgi:hypothetical protein